MLRLDVLGSKNREIAAALGYSKGQIKRIKSMPEYKKLKDEILAGEHGTLVERTKAQLATLLPTAADTYEAVMTDKAAHNRDRISAADSVMDRFVPKQTRAQVDSRLDSRAITIHLHGQTVEEFLSSPTDLVESSFEIVCKDCHKSYPPDTKHTCGSSKPTEADEGRCDLCGEPRTLGHNCAVFRRSAPRRCVAPGGTCKTTPTSNGGQACHPHQAARPARSALTRFTASND
ncbi:MAG: hypothetical protein JSV86_16185 [Gemmatimonadota bacterium]|nr:MAG: hypothetical protein JSV86_16185 [Gemmatimonadota bacterium]